MITSDERHALASEAADRAERAANYAAACVSEAMRCGDGGNPDSPAAPVNQAARWATEARRAVDFIADTVGEAGDAWEYATRELARANKAAEDTRAWQSKADRAEAYVKASDAAHEQWARENAGRMPPPQFSDELPFPVTEKKAPASPSKSRETELRGLTFWLEHVETLRQADWQPGEITRFLCNALQHSNITPFQFLLLETALPYLPNLAPDSSDAELESALDTFARLARGGMVMEPDGSLTRKMSPGEDPFDDIPL